MNIAIPKIKIEQTRAFSKAWDSGGVKIILDETSLKFATDWANIVLRSFVEDQVKKAMAAQKVVQEKNTGIPISPTNAVSTQTITPVTQIAAQKPNIILTD